MPSRFILPFADVGSGILPSSGSKLYFYAAGTTTPKDTHTTKAATTTNSNPLVSDSKGVFPDIFISGSYKVILKDKNNVQKWEADPVDELSVGDADTNLINDLSQAYIFDTVTAYQESAIVFPVGKIIHLKDRCADFEVIAGIGTTNNKNIIASTEVNQSIDLIIDDNLSLKALGEVRDDSTDNTDVIQFAINFAATNKINEIIAGSGVSRFTKLYFTHDSVNNPDFPSVVRSGWGLKLKGKGRLYTEDVAQIENEILLTLGSVFRSTIATGDAVNAEVENTSTVQQGLQFEGVGFIGDTDGFIFKGSAVPQSRLLDSVSFHNKHLDGSGVQVQDVYVSTWNDVLISGQDFVSLQTGTGLNLRNRLFAGGGLWTFNNINVRGFKFSALLGYVNDPAFNVKLLDSIVLNGFQSRNAFAGTKIGGKFRSATISGYHTEACTNTGMTIAAEAASIKIAGSYFDCGLCASASLVLGNSAGVAGANLDERTWSEISIEETNFIDVNAVGVKIADGTIGDNLKISRTKFGKVAGAGTLGIDFDNFGANVAIEQVRYTGLTSDVANRPTATWYVDDGNFEANTADVMKFQSEAINVESLVAVKFLSGIDEQNQVITPDAVNSRVVLTSVNVKRKFVFNNPDTTFSINLRDSTNTTTLKSVPPETTITAISDGSTWFFI